MSGSILPVFRRALGDSWRSLIGWSLGVTAAISLYLPLYPSLAGPDMGALLDSLPEQMVRAIGYDSISTGAGYTQSTFHGLVGFALLTIAATSWGSSAIAGDEEAGSLELTLAHGVSRAQLVLERSAALVVRLAWLGLLTAALIIALDESAALDIEPVNALAGSAALIGLILLSGTLAIAVGAVTGRRVFATGAGAGIAVLGYTLNAVANQGDDLGWLHSWSPYAWAYANTPLADGADAGSLALLFGIAVALIAIAAVALDRRDISP